LAEWLWIGRVSSDFNPAPIMFMIHRDTPGLAATTSPLKSLAPPS